MEAFARAKDGCGVLGEGEVSRKEEDGVEGGASVVVDGAGVVDVVAWGGGLEDCFRGPWCAVTGHLPLGLGGDDIYCFVLSEDGHRDHVEDFIGGGR